MPLKQYHKSCARITCDKCSLYLETEEEGMSNPLNVFIGKRPEPPETLAKEKVLEAAAKLNFVEVSYSVRQKDKITEGKSRWLCPSCQNTDPEWQVLKQLMEPKPLFWTGGACGGDTGPALTDESKGFDYIPPLKEVPFTVQHANESPSVELDRDKEELPRGGFF